MGNWVKIVIDHGGQKAEVFVPPITPYSCPSCDNAKDV